MLTSAQGLPPFHMRDGRAAVNSRDLAKYFNRYPNYVYGTVTRLLSEGRMNSSDVMITKANGLHRFDSFDIALSGLEPLVNSFKRVGNRDQRDRLLARVKSEMSDIPLLAAEDLITHRKGSIAVVNSNDLATYYRRDRRDVLIKLNAAVKADPSLRADIWEIEPQPNKPRSVEIGWTAFSVIMASFRGGPSHPDDAKITQALILAFNGEKTSSASPASQNPVSDAPVASVMVPVVKASTPIDAVAVKIERDGDRRFVNSHTLARLLNEKHRALRNAITHVAAHDIWFSRRVTKSKPRGEVIGKTYDLDRDAAIRVLNEFGETKRERIIGPLIAAFDGVSFTPSAALVTDPTFDGVLDQVATPEIPMTVHDVPVVIPQSIDDDLGPDPVPGQRPVVYDRQGTLLTTSRDVASYFGKRHHHVLRDIDVILDQAQDAEVPDLVNDCFRPATERHPSIAGQVVRHYEMDERGLMVVVGRFTGAKALAKQMQYAQEFKRMRDLLAQPVKAVSIDELIANPVNFVKLFQAYTDLAAKVQGGIEPRLSASAEAVIDQKVPKFRSKNKNAIIPGVSMSMTAAAHHLNYSSRHFADRLKSTGLIGADKKPTAKANGLNLFTVKSGVGYNGTDYTQTRVTTTGLAWLKAHVSMFDGVPAKPV